VNRLALGQDLFAALSVLPCQYQFTDVEYSYSDQKDKQLVPGSLYRAVLFVVPCSSGLSGRQRNLAARHAPFPPAFVRPRNLLRHVDLCLLGRVFLLLFLVRITERLLCSTTCSNWICNSVLHWIAKCRNKKGNTSQKNYTYYPVKNLDITNKWRNEYIKLETRFTVTSCVH
jgi:hypothetical protein